MIITFCTEYSHVFIYATSIFFAGLIILSSGVFTAPKVTIQSIRVADKVDGSVRVVFDATDIVNHQPLILSAPDRLVVDLDSAALKTNGLLGKIKNKLIKQSRFATSNRISYELFLI